MSRTKMSDKPHLNPDNGRYTEPFGRCGDIEYAPERINEEYTPRRIDLTRIKDGIHHMRWLSGLEKYPYEEGIEGLRTSLICTLNILSELVTYLEDNDGHD